MASSSTETDPPLFSFQITNPVTYLKNWWKKVMGDEGIKFTLQIKPVTAFVLALIFCGAGFGIGRLVIPAPLIKYIPITPSFCEAKAVASPTPNPWKETAYSGKLQYSNRAYYLITTGAEAISLTVPSTINLEPLVSKRIMAVGNYNKSTKTMVVSDATNLEVLPTTKTPIPTVKPTPIPSPSLSPTRL